MSTATTCALVHQLYEAVQSAPAVKGMQALMQLDRPIGSVPPRWLGGSTGQLTNTADCRAPAPPVLDKRSTDQLRCELSSCVTHAMSSDFCLIFVSFLRNAATTLGDISNRCGTRTKNPFGRFRHVTALSQPQLTHSPASVGDEDPAAHGNGAVLLTVTAYMAYGASRGATIEGHPVGHRRSR